MHKWQSTLLMVMGGIVPAVVAIVTLHQFGIIGLDTALLLGLLYLLFISTHVWCRIFTKIPPTSAQHEQQVDSLPCYEEAVKSDPPPYSSLYPGNPTSCDGTASSISTPTSAASKPVFTSATPQFNYHHDTSNSVTFHPLPEETPDDLPILGRIHKDTRRNSMPVIVPAQTGGEHPTTPGSSEFPAASCDTSPEHSEGEERRPKRERMYSRILESVANPVDYV